MRGGGMRCLTWTPLSILGGPYFFFLTVSLFSPDFGVENFFVLASVARTPLERFARTPLERYV